MVNKKNISYFILLIASLLFVKSTPGIITHYLYRWFGYVTFFGSDTTSETTVIYSMYLNEFDILVWFFSLALFIFAFLLLREKQNIYKITKLFNFVAGLGFCFLAYASYALVYYEHFLINFEGAQTKHSFFLVCLIITSMLFITLLIIYLFIWLDASFSYFLKYILLCLTLIVACFCVFKSMYFFWYYWDTSSPEYMDKIYSFILVKYGLAIFCSSEDKNPCMQELEKKEAICSITKYTRIIPYTSRNSINNFITAFQALAEVKCAEASSTWRACDEFYKQYKQARGRAESAAAGQTAEPKGPLKKPIETMPYRPRSSSKDKEL